MNAAM